jgi:L-amino acid N-acyltransferase YncA
MRQVILKDGREVLIRSLTSEDLDQLMTFYRELPLEDRKYLRIDVTDKSAVEQRIQAVKNGTALRYISLMNDTIISIGALEFFSDEWHRNHGEIRVVVARDHQRKGLGMIMISELYLKAVEHKVEKVIAKMMKPQVGARKIFKKLGFKEDVRIPAYVTDLERKTQDLVIMSCDIKDLWKELETLYRDSDWTRCR